jgi:alcohol dehydrogenase class IV
MEENMISGNKKFFSPTQFIFGDGCSEEVGARVTELGGSRVLVVTDPGLIKVGLPDKIISNIEKAGHTIVLFADVKENPTEDNVNQGSRIILDQNIDILVAVGGGSSLDAAKAMGVLSVHGGDIVDYEYGLKPFTQAGPPLITIPTTAGTGSEATMGAVIHDQKSHRKFDVVSPLMFPRLSLVDPEVTVSLPPLLTGATGMDALTHSIEGYTATLASPLTDAIHLQVISLIGKYLVRAYNDGTDREARNNMMMASMMAGIGFPNSGLGAVHGLSLPLGGHYGIPHGIANAIMLPYVMEFNLDSCRGRFSEIAAALDTGSDEPESSIKYIFSLLETLKIPTLNSYPVAENDLEKVSIDALGRNTNCVTNPREVTLEDARNLYLKALQSG